MSWDPAPTVGLRERKRQLVIQHIQETALDLFDEAGFDAVTVEQIAAAADVSPSTVYRHFGTKDRLVLHDEEDRIMIAMLVEAARERPVIDAARAVLDDIVELLAPTLPTLQRRMRYMFDIPVVHSAMNEEAHEAAHLLATELAALRGRPADDLAAQFVASVLVAAITSAAERWRRDEFASDYGDLLAQCLDVAADGLRY